MEVYITRMLHSFGSDNSKLRMSCNCIGMGLVTYYMDLVMILEVIGNGIGFAIIIETITVVAGVLGYGFVLIIEFCFSFWNLFGNI